MPPLKRKGLPKKAKKTTNILFEFLDDITEHKKGILTKDNEHGYSKFMICRFLSMHEPYLPLVDVYLNKHQSVLDNFQFHKLCIALIPKKKIYMTYIKGVPPKTHCKEALKYISDYFEVSEDNAYDYYSLCGEDLVKNIKRLYGIIE